jgi:hypothetical protein
MLTLPGSYLRAMFYLGLAFSGFMFYKLARFTQRSLFTYLRSLFNSRKYLSSEIKASQQHSKYYAVIYGSANRIGNAYARFLADKGFNLILIERDLEPLNDLDIALN